MTSVEPLPASPEVDSQEVELPLLASEAAIEFDSAIRGKAQQFHAAKALGDYIRNHSVNDFIAESSVYQALVSSEWRSSAATANQAMEEATALSELLRTPETN